MTRSAGFGYGVPMTSDLAGKTLRELLAAHVEILQEITRRGLARTRGSIVGELGERIALAAYGGSLETAGNHARLTADTPT